METTIEIDARLTHPDIIFFQHRGSRWTVAVDRESGEIINQSPEWMCVDERAKKLVLLEARRYQRSREKPREPRMAQAVKDDKLPFGATLRERGA